MRYARLIRKNNLWKITFEKKKKELLSFCSQRQNDTRTAHGGDATAHSFRAERRRVDARKGSRTHQGMAAHATALASVSR